MAQQFDPYEPVPDHLADTGPIRRVKDGFGLAARGRLAQLDRSSRTDDCDGAAAADTDPAARPLSPLCQPTDTPTPQIAAPTSSRSSRTSIRSASSTQSADAQPGSDGAAAETPVAPRRSSGRAGNCARRLQRLHDHPGPPAQRSDPVRNPDGRHDFRASPSAIGLKPETIAWSNDRAIIEGLRPGKTAQHPAGRWRLFHGDLPTQSIDSIAQQYHVDPYAIIDSEYNDLFGDTPDTVLPSGTQVVVPGGTAEQINWNPPVQRVAGNSSSGSSGGAKISFDIGDPGSCGLVDNPGGGGGWVKPLASYVWVRGFSSIHSGVDLSAAIGTPVMAANGGTVIFAGWSNWGYGYSVVLAHGPFTTVYGHMSAVYARCGAYVNAGQVIGAVGSTGEFDRDRICTLKFATTTCRPTRPAQCRSNSA